MAADCRSWGTTRRVDDVRDFLDVDDRRIWVLVGLCILTVFTIQAVENAIEGAWPHQRRTTRLMPRTRMAQGSWGVVAVLVLPGLVLAILNLIVMLWRDAVESDLHRLGGLLVGIGWLAFLLASADRLPFRRYVSNLGVIAPAALAVVLLVGDVLLLIGLLDILPSLETVRDALPFG